MLKTRLGEFVRENLFRIVFGLVVTSFMVYMGNFNMLWMLLVAFFFRL